MKFFTNLKARYYFILFGAMIIVDVVLILCMMHMNNRKVAAFILLVCFLLTGAFLNGGVFKVFSKKAEKLNTIYYNFKGVDFLKDSLKDFTINERSFGVVYSKVIDKCAYKVTFVTDYSKYNEEEDNSYKKTPGIDDAKWLIGFEIFNTLNDELSSKLKYYSMSGEKLYYLGFYIDGDKIVDVNHVEPYTYLEKNYRLLCDKCGIYEEENNNL